MTPLLVLLIGPAPVSGLAKAITEYAAEQERQSATLRFTGRFTLYERDGRVRQVSEYVMLIGGDRFRMESATLPPRPVRPSGSGRTDRYVYDVVRRGAVGWKVDHVAARPDRPRWFHQPEAAYASSVLNERYTDVLTRPGTTVVTERELDWRGERHRELVVGVRKLFGDPAEYAACRYGLIVHPLLPGLVRGVRQYDPANPDRWTTEEVFAYRPEGDPPTPVVEAVESYRVDATGGPPWRYRVDEILESSRSAVPRPDGEFGLLTFGLPEPDAVPPADTERVTRRKEPDRIVPPPAEPDPAPPVWPWAAGGVVVGGVGGWWMRRASRQASRGPSGPG